MKTNIQSLRSRNGIALVVALILLAIIIIIGVTSLSSVVMQERMASSSNLQALAFEAASAGISETPEWARDRNNWPTGPDGEPVECIRGEGDFLGDWFPPLGQPGKVLNVSGLPEEFRVEYRKRLGCFEAEGWTLLVGPDLDFDPPQQLLALARGQVVRPSDNSVLATREIEVRLEERGRQPTCLIQIGPIGNLRMPDSGRFSIDARPDGCPIMTANESDAERMRGQLGQDRLGNYQPTDPGISAGDLEGIWGDAHGLARGINAVKIGVRLFNQWESAGLDDNPFSRCGGRLQVGNQNWNPPACGQSVPGGLTYIAGNLTVGGNCPVHGMVLIEGGYYSGGTPAYDGDLLIVGGEVDVGGFGSADNSGLLLLQHLVHGNTGNDNPNSTRVAYQPDDVLFGTSDFIIRGGGNATIMPRECESLQQTWHDLNFCLADLQDMVETETSWVVPGNNGDDTVIEGSVFEQHAFTLGLDIPGDLDVPDLLREDEDENHPVRFPIPRCDADGTGARMIIASWREFIDRGRWD
jgi:hypothetical protein